MKKRFCILLLLFVCASWIDVKPYALEKANDSIEVTVTGAINEETTLVLPMYATIQDALQQVTLLENADTSCINQQTILKDADCIHIPEKQEVKRISINSGTIEDLCTLNGIGESTAQRIIEYREGNGLFQTIEDLMNVKGIGTKKFEKIKDFICL